MTTHETFDLSKVPSQRMFMWATYSPKIMWFGFKYDSENKYAAYFKFSYSFPEDSFIEFYNLYNGILKVRRI